MLLAVLASSPVEADTLCTRIRNSRSGRSGTVEPVPFSDQEAFFSTIRSRRCGAAIIALGDAAGFLAARKLWETDHGFRILMIDDTDRYALQCIRIHVADFLIRPVSDERLDRSLSLLLE